MLPNSLTIWATTDAWTSAGASSLTRMTADAADW